MSLLGVLRADLNRQFTLRGEGPRQWSLATVLIASLSPRFMPVFNFRVGSWLARHRLRPLGKLFSLANFIFFGLEIALDAEIGPGLFFPHTVGTVLGAKRIGANAVIYHNVTVGAKVPDLRNEVDLRPEIGDDAFLGAGCKILGPIVLGDRVTVGANAVVLTSFQTGSLVVGIPGRMISKD